MDVLLTQLAGVFFQALLQQILQHMPEIAAAFKTATTTTLADAQDNPVQDAALAAEQANAVKSGTLPPFNVR